MLTFPTTVHSIIVMVPVQFFGAVFTTATDLQASDAVAIIEKARP